MKRIPFNPRFVNEAGNDLIPGKIHTIRQNYDYWKRFEGQEVALFTWEGKPCRKGSRQKVFCVKRIVSVQEVEKKRSVTLFSPHAFTLSVNGNYLNSEISINDGFAADGKYSANTLLAFWLNKYPDGKMAVLHFTDFRY